MGASTGKLTYIILLAVFGLCQQKCYSYDVRCPHQSEWNLKASTRCSKILEYFCLFDDNGNIYTEFCRRNPNVSRDVTWKIGQKCVLRGDLDGEICSTERYQPFKFRTDGNSDCVYKKSPCQGEGILIYKNGSTTSDMQCRCDYTKDFAFVSKTKQSCFCNPSQEDCSCYIKKCKRNYKLSSDYSCTSIYSPEGQSACSDHDTRLLTKSDSQMDKSKQFNTNVSSEIDMNQSLIKMMTVKRHAAITVTVLTGVIIVIFSIVMMECFRNVYKNDMMDDETKQITPKTPGNVDKNGKMDEKKEQITSKINGLLQTTIEKQEDYNENIPEKTREVYKTYISDWNKEDNKFYVTRGTNRIDEMLRANNCVLVVGRSGNGKSSTIRHIALKLSNEDGYDIIPIVLDPTTVLRYANSKRKQIFVIDNFCDKIDKDDENVKMWSSHIDEILKLILKNQEPADQTSANGSIKLIFATALDVLDDVLSKRFICLSKYKFHLSELPLQGKEKIEMIKKYFIQGQMSDTLTNLLKGQEDIYPFLCKLSEGKTAEQIIQLFKNPNKVIIQDFAALQEENKTKLCLITLCVLLENLKDDTFCIKDTHEQYKIIVDVCSQFDLDLLDKFSQSKLQNELKNLDETYFVKLGDTYHFVHKIVYDIAAVYCGQFMLSTFIEVAPSSFIAERYIYFKSKDEDENTNLICIPDTKTLNKYFARLINDLKNGITYSTFHNRQLNNKSYRNKFREYCRRENKKVVKYLNRLGNRTLLEKTNEEKRTTTEEKDNDYTDYIDFTKSYQFSSHNMKIPLIESAWEGYEDIVVMLFEMEQDIDETDKFGRTALLVACQLGKENVALQLLRLGAKQSKYDDNKTSPLLAACKGGYIYPKLIDMLLTYGADPTKCDKDLCSPLHAASVANHKRIVQELLKCKVDILHRDIFGRSALFLASYNGRKAVVEILLKNGAEIDECDRDGSTPLIAACSNGKLNVVTELLKRNADISKRDNEGRSALFIACEKRENRTVDLLLMKKADVSQCDRQGRSPLYIACSLGHEQIVRSLLNYEAVISQCNGEGQSPLFIACEKGLDTILDILLDKCSVEDLEKVDKQERSPLYVASKGGFNGIVRKLVSRGAKVNKSNRWKMTPLLVASREGHSQVVKYLIKENANLEVAEFNGRTPLSVACDDGNVEVVRILIKNGSKVDHTDYEKNTPIELAVKSDHKDIVEFLNATGKSKKQH